MTTTRKLVELFRAIGAEDIGGATALASQLCKLEERKGHRLVARQLRGALQPNGYGHSIGRADGHSLLDQSSASSGIGSSSLFSSALSRLDRPRNLDDVVLSASVRAELESVVLEWKNAKKLRALGVQPRAKLLFHGPPGCGKSLTAQALATSLGLPVFMVRFDAVIGAFLGQTAIHLRQIFHFAETTPCVLLLDELDALGKRRGNPLDVGELDRIVISLLQELEHSKPLGIVIGTTNLAKNLDDALWRRFDLDLHFSEPSKSILRKFASRLGRDRKFSVPPNVLKRCERARSFSSAERIVLDEVRRQALKREKRSNGIKA